MRFSLYWTRFLRLQILFAALAATILIGCSRSAPPSPEPPALARDTTWRLSGDSGGAQLRASNVDPDLPGLKISCSGSTLSLSVGLDVSRGASTVGATDFRVLKIAGFDRRIVVAGKEIVPRLVYDDYMYMGVDPYSITPALMDAEPDEVVEFRQPSQRTGSSRYLVLNLPEVWRDFLTLCRNIDWHQ